MGMVSKVFVVVVALVCVSCLADDVPGIRYVPNGISGSGWATRYWDCCKPSCSWTANAVHTAQTCRVDGTIITDTNERSTCDGGAAAACTSQVPIVVNDNLAYAFAAVPAANGGYCGKCFDLEFTGEGKYDNDDLLRSLKGKHLIVMCSNVGTDVQSGQFDVMIPGGGVGIFNGCGSMVGWNLDPTSERYGGMLSDCERSCNYVRSCYRSCLEQKCNSAFSGDANAKEGCLFLAHWMNCAGNPLHNFREVECPMLLKEMY